MPLISDAKSCFVGGTEISKIYAGSVQVWPKNPGCYPPAEVVGHYHFENDFKNSEGTASDFTLQASSFEFKDGLFGRCLSPVDASVDSVLTANAGPLGNQMTLECWFKEEGDGREGFMTVGYSSKTILDPDYHKDSNNFGFTIYGNDKVDAFYGYLNEAGSGAGNVLKFDDVGIVPGEWVHVAVAFDATAGKTYLWLNGTFRASNLIPFDASKPLENLDILSVIEFNSNIPIPFDEVRLSQGVVYPLQDIFPCFDPPEFSQVAMKIGGALPGGNKSILFYPVSWSVDVSECALLPEYETRWGFSSTEGLTPPTTWQGWRPLWDGSGYSVFDPVAKRIYWANPYAEMEDVAQGYRMWNEVREKETKKIVVPPCQTDTTASEIPYPDPRLIC